MLQKCFILDTVIGTYLVYSDTSGITLKFTSCGFHNKKQQELFSVIVLYVVMNMTVDGHLTIAAVNQCTEHIYACSVLVEV